MNVKAVGFFVVCALFFNSVKATEQSYHQILALVEEHENIVAIKCILNIMKKEIPCSTVVTLVYSNDDVNYLVESINVSECYTVIIRSFNDYNWLIKTSAYVIITENVQELALGMALITVDSFWNPRAQIIAHAHDISNEDMNDAFNIFMKYRTYDAVFVTNNDTDDNAEVFTYFPFENGACGMQFDEVHFITYCNSFASVNDFFPNKYENRMKNCSVTALVNEELPNIEIQENGNYTTVSGIEADLLKTIAQIEGLQLNFVISSKDDDLGAVLPNHTATGALASLQNNKVDIVAGGYILIQNRANIFDYIYGFNFASYNLYTAALDEPVWKTLYEELDELSWVFLCVTFFLIIIVTIITLLMAPKMMNSYSDVILKLWSFFFIGNSSGTLFKIGRIRFLLTCWIWFTFFITNFYNTALYSLITAYVEPVHYIGADNFDSISLKPCVSNHIRELFLFAYNQTLHDNVRLNGCSYSESALEIVSSREDLYAIEMTYSYDIREYKFIDDEGSRMLDTWSFSTDNILSILLARGFPLRDRFQTLSLQLYEGGFLEYQANVYLQRSKSTPTHPNIFRRVQLGDLTNHYIVLGVGIILSTICLFIEMCVHRRKFNQHVLEQNRYFIN